MKLNSIATGIVLFITALFTAYAFFIPQECDIDAVYLWCRLHPLSFFDLVGLVLFYSCCLVLSGLPFVANLELFNEENSSTWNLAAFVGGVLGIVLIWNC